MMFVKGRYIMGRMLRIIGILVCIISSAFLYGCGSGEGSDVKPFVLSALSSSKVVGEDIQKSDITDFYYTVENINYDASYQRYVFYDEHGMHTFFHETRERKDDYGPTTSEDTTRIGRIELTEDQWSHFYELISGGTVKKREESADAGDSGPWLYLYWTGDKSIYQEYSFASYADQKAFEEYCVSIAETPLSVSVEQYPPLDDSFCGKWMGYFDRVSGEYHLELEDPVDGEYPVSLTCSWMYDSNGGGMSVDIVDITGSAVINEDGLMILTGSIYDGSSGPEKKITAVLGQKNDRISMYVLDCYQERIYSGNRFEFSREQ